MTESKTIWRRTAIFVFTLPIALCLLLPQSAMTASAATAVTNKIHQANSVKVARSSRKKTSLKTPGTVKHLAFSKYGRIVYVSWNRPANTTGSALYKVYYKIGSRSWKTRLTSSATVRIDVGYHQLLKVKIRAYNRRGSTKKAGAVSSVFKTVTAQSSNSGSQDNASDTSEDSGENTHSQTPGVPSGISMEGSSDGTVTVSWDEPSGRVTSYEMSYKIGDDDWQTADVDSCSGYTLPTGYDKTILVKVRALNGDKAGNWSETESYYMKPEYGHYEIGTQSVTLNIGETKKISCKYIEGWKGKKAGWEHYHANAIVCGKSTEPGVLYIIAQEQGDSTYTLFDEGPSGRESYTITIHVKDPALDEKVDQIKEEMGITDSSSDLMKARLAAEWMVKHTSYDYDTYNSGDYTKADISLKHTLLDDNPKTICEGYAKAYTYILEDLNVPVKTILYDSGDHAWNIVKIDGNWYNVDTTWMDNGTRVNWKYFMVSYGKLNSLDTDHHHDYYTDSNLAQYRTDDTRFDNWTSKWADYTDSSDSSGAGAETDSGVSLKDAA